MVSPCRVTMREGQTIGQDPFPFQLVILRKHLPRLCGCAGAGVRARGNARMKRLLLRAAAATALCAAPALAADKTVKPEKSDNPAATTPPPIGAIFEPESVTSGGQVTVEGQKIDYRAVAGTLVVHPKGWDDAVDKAVASASGDKAKEEAFGDNPRAEASMFYVAYFKNGVPSRDRPITFLYNGGPGSSTGLDRKSTPLNSRHQIISYAVFFF